jgi:hypothetical protein
VIQTELQYDGDQRERDRQKRQHSKLVGSQQAGVNGHQHKSECTVDHAADSKNQSVFDGFFYLVV